MSIAKWRKQYKDGCNRLDRVKNVGAVLSVFNANIDAVRAVSSNSWQEWLDNSSISPQAVEEITQCEIDCKEAFFKGFLDCFSNGIAKEWLIKDFSLFQWLQQEVGYDTLQMGGQGGIIANVLSLCEIERVLVHAASLPEEQASLFLDRENLLSVNEAGVFEKARLIKRDADTPLIHWILEFKKGDTIELGSRVYTCPKSNRFIATWDPLNFKLELDSHFVDAVDKAPFPLAYCLLAGYQMLTEPLADGSSALERIWESKRVVQGWQQQNPAMVVHFEFASTQDIKVRKFLLDEMGSWVDSIGLNEQELIDLLEIIGEEELARECVNNTHAVPLYKGLEQIFAHTEVNRIQLHMFGLYITLLRSTDMASAIRSREGMVLAATVAASKAGSGALEKPADLRWAEDESVADISMGELSELGDYLSTTLGFSDDGFAEHGIAISDSFSVIAIPTILIEKPVTLVGMGDTISSISLIGSDASL